MKYGGWEVVEREDVVLLVDVDDQGQDQLSKWVSLVLQHMRNAIGRYTHIHRSVLFSWCGSHHGPGSTAP